MHLIFAPFSIILLTTNLVAKGVSGTWKNNFTVAVLHFFVVIGQFPFTHIQGLVYVLKLSKTGSWNFWNFLRKMLEENCNLRILLEEPLLKLSLVAYF
jgi:hypothetical protein